MKKIQLSAIALLILAVIAAIGFWTTFYRVDATEIVVFQAPFTGTLSVVSVPGTYPRIGAGAHPYRKQDNYDFEWVAPKESRGANDTIITTISPDDRSIQVQFNDGGKAWIGGNVQWEMPIDEPTVLALHTLYGSQAGVDQRVMRNAIYRAMTFTAPLMSATESYAARRAEFLTIFADQLENGIYQMSTTDSVVSDPITNERRSIKLTSIVRDTAGHPIIAEESPLKKYGIKIQPPTITHIIYEPKVEQQIQQVRDNTLSIQTSQAQAKRAEQDALTAAKNGEALAVKSRYEQEVVKAADVTKAERDRDVAALVAAKDKAVAETAAQRDKIVAETNAARDKNVQETAAQRDLDVAVLNAKAAEQFKIRQTLEGEGEAAKRTLVMAADGALAQKLNTYLEAQRVWATAFQNFRGDLVPRIMTSSPGGAAGGSDNVMTQFMGLMSAKVANDLMLDLRLPAATQAAAIAR